jgi:hypothetical protein
MSTDFTSDASIESKEAFETALIDLVQTAQANGVDPAGFYESRLDNGHADFEISLVELAKKSN